jgi:hypothetical protein
MNSDLHTLPPAPPPSAVPAVPFADVPEAAAPRAFVEWLDPANLKIADERFDLGDYLRSRAVPQVTVTWPARVLVWAVMAAVTAYCAAIWCGAVL